MVGEADLVEGSSSPRMGRIKMDTDAKRGQRTAGQLEEFVPGVSEEVTSLLEE